jgi:bifunctional hydroxylase/dehydrase
VSEVSAGIVRGAFDPCRTHINEPSCEGVKVDTTVVIVGAGPTGLMLACELGLAGVPTVVLEASALPRADAPAVAINVGAVEQLDRRGLLEPLKRDATTLPLPRTHFALFPLDVERMGERYANSLIVTQRDLSATLEKRARELGVVIRRDHQVVGLDRSGDGVRVTALTQDGTTDIACRYLVGCDGIDSTVRDLAGIAFPSTESPFYGLVGDFRAVAKEMPKEHLGYYHSQAGGMYMCLPIGPDTVRLMTAEFGRAPEDRESVVTPEETRTTIHRLTGTDPGPLELRWMSRYRNLSGLADAYHEDGVFLAGDAAHAMFPLNGQAITSGLHDAVNLGWKLAAAVHGWAAPDLLDTYHAERWPVGRRACVNIRAQISLSEDPDQVAPLREVVSRLASFEEGNAHLVEMVMGLDIDYSDPSDTGRARHALLGRVLPPVQLKTEDGPTDTARLSHAGRGVLLDLSGDPGTDWKVAGWQDRIDVVAAAPAPELAVRALLLRPDGHVAWVAPEHDARATLHATLDRWFGSAAPADR